MGKLCAEGGVVETGRKAKATKLDDVGPTEGQGSSTRDCPRSRILHPPGFRWHHANPNCDLPLDLTWPKLHWVLVAIFGGRRAVRSDPDIQYLVSHYVFPVLT